MSDYVLTKPTPVYCKLNIICDNLNSSGDGSYYSILLSMKVKAGVNSTYFVEVCENIQYVNGFYNGTYAYYKKTTQSNS